MLDIVAPNEDELPLAIEAERVDEAKPGLTGSPARDAQPMGERQPVEDRENDERSNAARRQESYLDDSIIRERKLVQPLHAQSNTPVERVATCSSASAFKRRLRRAAEKPRSPATQRLRWRAARAGASHARRIRPAPL
jgi:hypothetical protein